MDKLKKPQKKNHMKIFLNKFQITHTHKKIKITNNTTTHTQNNDDDDVGN